MRTRGRIDRNQPEIVRALRQFGASVVSLSDLGDGVPDLLVGFRGHNVLMEIKDPMARPADRKLTEDQQLFHKTWSGSALVVETSQEAIRLLSTIG